jgi:hypothetical protein
VAVQHLIELAMMKHETHYILYVCTINVQLSDVQPSEILMQTTIIPKKIDHFVKSVQNARMLTRHVVVLSATAISADRLPLKQVPLKS